MKNEVIEVKKKIIEASFKSKEGHIPSSFSVLNLIFCLFKGNYIFKRNKYLNNFILSKGHGCLAFYAMLFHSKKISKKVFFSFCKKDSILGGHPDMNKSKYITASTGSLGHGLPIISGMVFADNLSNIKKNYYIILGDQECLEGTTWETMFILNKFKLNKLTIIIDRNAIPLGNLKKKLSGFSSNILTINGHNHKEIIKALNKPNKTQFPKIIIAKTIKGNGSKFLMHNSWHHRFPKNEEELNILFNDLKE
jgi:transketolase